MNDSYGDRRDDAERQEHDTDEAKKGRHPIMKLNPMNDSVRQVQPQSPRAAGGDAAPHRESARCWAWRTCSSSIAVPEPFSLEMAGDMDGVTLMARCLDGGGGAGPDFRPTTPRPASTEVPQAEDPLRLEEGEQAWSMTLRAQAAPTTRPCGSSATTTCWTPARTPSSPCWALCQT